MPVNNLRVISSVHIASLAAACFDVLSDMFAHFNLILLSTSHVLTSGYTSDMRRLKHLKVFMWITHIWSSKFSDLLLKSFLSSGNHLLSCVDRVDAVGSCTI